MKHIFALCAYGDSPYLADCIASLKAQSEPSEILLCTATPSDALARAARENGLRYCVNPAPPNISGDWNFALRMAREAGADYATLCHQDDLYLPGYGAAFRRAAQADPSLLIFFTGYGEKRGGETVTRSRLLTIKRLLLWRMRIRPLQTSRFAKRRTLALGDPICCPSVTFNLNRLPLPLFEKGLSASLDWQTWERLSRLPGRFAYDPEVLMLHRIHPGSTTTAVLHEGGRAAQDFRMFRLFWPAPIARLLTRLYAASERSNDL